MSIIIFIIALLTWFILGYYGFKFWWTKDMDFTMADKGFALYLSIMGPLTWIMGAIIHCNGDDSDQVVTPRKKRR
jgi:hypothetical protein